MGGFIFRDREHAAALLARELHDLAGRRPLVLAIPRGAVPMGRVIAAALGGDFDVVLVHKLGAPGNPELAIGAVGEDGEIFFADHLDELPVPEGYLEAEAAAQISRLRERRRRYSPHRQASDPAGRRVIVVDDGVATGSTLLAALRVLRPKRPAELIVAVGVAPSETAEKLRREADRVVCLTIPRRFYAVGQFFEDFSEVSDDEVIRCLAVPPAAAAT